LSSLKSLHSLSPGRDPMASTLFPSIDSSINFKHNKDWHEKSYQMSLRVKQHNSDSCRVRVTSTIVREVVQDNDNQHLRKVNIGIRHKMGQTQDMTRKLVKAMRENSVQTKALEQSKERCMQAKNELVAPYDLTLRRMEIRESHPQREKVQDLVFMALEREAFSLGSTINQLGDIIDTTETILERLQSIRGKMNGDLKQKKRALELDGECLALTYRTAAQHPPKTETFHTRITTVAGEVPPAPPTSVLYGENATGRFSYEWLFSKDEREALKVAFQQHADDYGEVLAHSFEMVYTAAGVHVTAEESPSVLQIMQLHPDTKMTWVKFCELLASMRTPSEETEEEHHVTLPHQWRHRTKALLESNEAIMTAARRLLHQGTELCQQTDGMRRKTCIAVQKSLRRKITQATDLRVVAEKRLAETDLEIRRLSNNERSLLHAFEAKAKPLMVSEARYNIRRQRSANEEVHDEVEDLIAKEVEELQKGVNAIQRELDNTRAKLDVLRENRQMLEEDIACKTAIIELDTKCLKLEDSRRESRRTMFNSFIQGHL